LAGGGKDDSGHALERPDFSVKPNQQQTKTKNKLNL